MSKLDYMSGFRNSFESQTVSNALPMGRNSPQKVAKGLYAEQLSGTAFTMKRDHNLRSWLYRIQPSVTHEPFEMTNSRNWLSPPYPNEAITPNQLRWDAIEYPKSPTDFLSGVHTICSNGSPQAQVGSNVLLYAINKAMDGKYFYNSDAEMLFVLQEGSLWFDTEFGQIEAEPLEIVCIPKGIKFRVKPSGERARGYINENFGEPFQLPNLGPIGSNGLAATRDFLTPTAWYEQKQGDFELVNRFQGNLWSAKMDHSPLDVIAWHGNYVPYKYDLRKFNVIGTVSFDHPDPSIFTVLTSPTLQEGVANVDFVIFPPRWMVGEDTFRPPYYHRNIMSEYMGLIVGEYDAKGGGKGGFVPGGGSLHNSMSAHGPDAATFDNASAASLKPQKINDTMAFMFESRFVFQPTPFALSENLLQKNYWECWKDLGAQFKA